MEARKAELARLREMELQELARGEAAGDSGDGLGLFCNAYVPTEDERQVLTSLQAAVARKMAVDPEELEAPHAYCTCIRDRGPRLAAYEEELAARGSNAIVAVDDNVARVRIARPGALPEHAGELVVSPHGVPYRNPVGEWIVTLQFRARTRQREDETDA